VALSGSTGILTDLLIVGNESDGSNNERGTWGHPNIAISIAGWISPKFDVWASEVLRRVIADEFAPKTADAAIAQSQLKQQHNQILDRAEPWEWMYTDKFCKQVYAWYGPQFYWTFCYCFLTPIERCKLDEINPVIKGDRKYRIHQFLTPEIKEKLTPYVNELLAIITMSKGDKQAFIAGYQEHFNGSRQLDLF
jgi:hypothetical protein